MTGWGTGAQPGRFPLELVYQAARMYYLDEVTQADIASRLSVSRATVSRLVAEARHGGLVRIEVVDPFRHDAEALAAACLEALHLSAVQVAPVVHPATLGSDLAPLVGAAVARMGLRPGDALLMGSGRAMHAVARDGLPRLAGVHLAPTVGGQADPLPWFQTNEIARVAAERSGAVPSFLFAQALPSVAMRASLDADPSFRQTVALWHRAVGALVGIGAPPATRDALARGVPVGDEVIRDAAGDVSLNFFRADGSEIDFAGAERMVRTPRAVLAAMEHVVAVAVDPVKAPSIGAAARAGLIDELITDTATARAVLAAVPGAVTPE